MRREALWLCVAIALVACDEQGSGSGAVAPDVGDMVGMDAVGGEDAGAQDAPSEMVSLLELCEASAALLCEVGEDQALLEAACRIGAIAASSQEMGPECAESYAQCLENPALLEGLVASFKQEVPCPEELGECAVTRAELDACLREQKARLATFGSLSCEDSLEGLEALYSDLGPACLALEGACDGDEPMPEGGFEYPVCGGGFEACGGDPAGEWVFSEVCVEEDDAGFEALLEVCPGSDITARVSASGTLSAVVDGRLSIALDLEREIEIEADRACAAEICEAMFERFDCSTQGMANNVCQCSQRGSGQRILPGWRVDGGILMASNEGGPSYGFCMDGDTMTLDMPGDEGLMAPIFTLERSASE